MWAKQWKFNQGSYSFSQFKTSKMKKTTIGKMSRFSMQLNRDYDMHTAVPATHPHPPSKKGSQFNISVILLTDKCVEYII